jgi:hypothetical protein
MSSSLALASGTCAGSGQKTERHFMEFVVDGERLGEVLGPFLGYDDATDNDVPILVTDWPRCRDGSRWATTRSCGATSVIRTTTSPSTKVRSSPASGRSCSIAMTAGIDHPLRLTSPEANVLSR